MAEYTAVAAQTVATNQNVLLTETAVNGTKCISHRTGSGIVTLRGIGTQCRARFLVEFGGNIAIPTGGTVGPIQLAIAINGEPLASATMIVTPAAVGNYFNVSAAAYIDVLAGCCVTVSVRNISTQSVLVQNANLIANRVA